MIELIVYVVFFYLLHLFLTMSLSLHEVPFINWTYVGGDISNKTELSERMTKASDNLRQTLPIFMIFCCLSIVMDVDNLLLAQSWFGLRIVYLLGAVINLYQYKMIRPLIWLPSIAVIACMGCNLIS